MNGLMRVAQLPIIEEHLRTQKDKWQQMAHKAEAMVCTVDTLQAVKATRAEMRKDFEDAEAQRKAIKAAIMERYNAFDAVYKDCITESYHRADAALSGKVEEVESSLKQQCEDSLREYFAELCAVHHLDWLGYERVGIRVDMASAKAKTPKKLREQLVRFVVGVAESVDRINSLEEYAGEIMVEYKRSLDAAAAICTVQNRHKRIEQEEAVRANWEAVRAAEREMVDRVAKAAATYLEPPVVASVTQDKNPEEIIPRCTFTALGATRAQLWKLKQFLEQEGISYE